MTVMCFQIQCKGFGTRIKERFQRAAQELYGMQLHPQSGIVKEEVMATRRFRGGRLAARGMERLVWHDENTVMCFQFQ